MGTGMQAFSLASALAWALAAALVLAVMTWLVGVAKRDVSVVDGVWSLLILGSALVGSWLLDGMTAVNHPAMLLLAAWALRLCLHIIWRGWGEAEDHRYQIIRERNQPNFAFKSLYLVFALQGVLAWIVSFPMIAIAQAGLDAAVPWLVTAGLVLAAAGLLYEALADWQLAAFKRDPGSRGKVMNRGLWRYSRHPNYFGEFCVWWGLFAAAIGSAGPSAAWTVLSPVLMSTLLMKVSGVPMLENGMAERRPGYRDYVLGTNAFFPGPSRTVHSYGGQS